MRVFYPYSLAGGEALAGSALRGGGCGEGWGDCGLKPSVRALVQAGEELRCCRREIRKLHSQSEVLQEAAGPLVHQAAAMPRS